MEGRPGRLQSERYLHSIVGKLDAPIFGTVDDAGNQQRHHIGMNSLHVAPDPPRSLANGDGASTAQRLEDVPALRKRTTQPERST